MRQDVLVVVSAIMFLGFVLVSAIPHWREVGMYCVAALSLIALMKKAEERSKRATEHRTRERLEVQEKEESAQKEAREQKLARFRKSDDIELVRRFVRKLNGMPSTSDQLEQLRALLGRWDFRRQELEALVSEESKCQAAEKVRSRLLSAGAKTLDEYCLAYLEVPKDERTRFMPILREVLRSAGVLHGSTDIWWAIPKEVERVERAASLHKFRTALLSDEEEFCYPSLDALDGLEFESLVADLYRRMGFAVRLTPASGDQGADVIVEKLGERSVIQAKCWKGSVGNGAVQEAAAAARHYGASRAVVVTTGKFTKSARALAASNKVELLERPQIEGLIRLHW